jgi:hypothetical protein
MAIEGRGKMDFWCRMRPMEYRWGLWIPNDKTESLSFIPNKDLDWAGFSVTRMITPCKGTIKYQYVIGNETSNEFEAAVDGNEAVDFEMYVMFPEPAFVNSGELMTIIAKFKQDSGDDGWLTRHDCEDYDKLENTHMGLF